MTSCAEIITELGQVGSDQAALYADSAASVLPLQLLAGAEPLWVSVGGEWLPSLGLLVGRIHNLGAGLAQWLHVEQVGGTTAITLPAACSATRTRVWLNGVPLGPGDVTISGTTATLAYGLNIGDQLLIRTYG